MKLGNIIGLNPELRRYAEGDLVKGMDLLGLEFEYEGVRDARLPNTYPLDLFSTHDDDSLKNYGKEFVFTEPLFGADVEHAVRALCDVAKERRWVSSRRAGIHVHVDVRDLTREQVIGLILLYSLVEPALYRWVGDQRDKSIYCMPLYETDGAAELVAGLLRQCQGGSGDSIMLSANHIPRYGGMNLNALAKFGSIEFRQLKSTSDSERVLLWIQLLLKLKYAVRDQFPMSNHAIIEIAERTGPDGFLRLIFGDLYTHVAYPQWGDAYKTLALPVAEALVAEGLQELVWASWGAPVGVSTRLALFDAKRGVREPDVLRHGAVRPLPLGDRRPVDTEEDDE